MVVFLYFKSLFYLSLKIVGYGISWLEKKIQQFYFLNAYALS